VEGCPDVLVSGVQVPLNLLAQLLNVAICTQLAQDLAQVLVHYDSSCFRKQFAHVSLAVKLSISKWSQLECVDRVNIDPFLSQQEFGNLDVVVCSCHVECCTFVLVCYVDVDIKFQKSLDIVYIILRNYCEEVLIQVF